MLFALNGVFFDYEYCLMEAMLFCFCEQFGEHCCFHAPHPTTLLARRKADSSAKRGQPNSYLEILITTDELAEDSSINTNSEVADGGQTYDVAPLCKNQCLSHARLSLSAHSGSRKVPDFSVLISSRAILRNIIPFPLDKQPF